MMNISRHIFDFEPLIKKTFISKDVTFDELWLGLLILPLEEIVNKSSMTILLLFFIEEENHVEPTNDVEEA